MINKFIFNIKKSIMEELNLTELPQEELLQVEGGFFTEECEIIIPWPPFNTTPPNGGG